MPTTMPFPHAFPVQSRVETALATRVCQCGGWSEGGMSPDADTVNARTFPQESPTYNKKEADDSSADMHGAIVTAQPDAALFQERAPGTACAEPRSESSPMRMPTEKAIDCASGEGRLTSPRRVWTWLVVFFAVAVGSLGWKHVEPKTVTLSPRLISPLSPPSLAIEDARERARHGAVDGARPRPSPAAAAPRGGCPAQGGV